MQTSHLCLALAAVMGAGAAHADRPLVSETADVIAPGACQIESALARTRAGSLDTARTWDSSFSCGLALQTQVALGYGREQAGGSTDQALRLAGKTTVVAPEDGRTGYGLAYGLAAVKGPGSGYKVEDFTVLALATRELASGLLGHANLGLSHSRSLRRSTALWSLGVETTADLTVAADLFGDDRDRPSVSAGVGYSFGGGFSANAAVALQFSKPQARVLSVGAKLVF